MSRFSLVTVLSSAIAFHLIHLFDVIYRSSLSDNQHLHIKQLLTFLVILVTGSGVLALWEIYDQREDA